MIVECLHDNRDNEVPRNNVIFHKRQEERYGRSRERGIFLVVTIELSIGSAYIRVHK